MKSTVFSRIGRATQMAARVVCSQTLSMAGIGCLSVALAGCSGLAANGLRPNQSTQSPQEDRAQNSAPPVRYTIQDLGVVGANPNAPGQPLILSDSGWISGGAAVGTAEHAVLWYGGSMIDIGNPGLGGNSFAYGVNESGMAAGEAENTATGLSTVEDFCGFHAMGFSSSPTPCVPFVWTGGQMVPLPTLGGVNGAANEINNNGAIAGYAENTTMDPGCTAPQQYQFKPVVWSSGGVQPLSTGSDAEGVAFSINDLGQAVGTSGSCAPFNPVWLFYLSPAHALLWQSGMPTDLGTLGGAFNNLAHHINNLGEVVGGSDLAGDQTSHAFLWTATTKMQDLGTVNDAVDDDSFSFGLGINDAGSVVGVSASADFSVIRAFIRQSGNLVDLNSLVAGSTSLYLMTACSINSRNEIIGIAIDPNTGQTHGYLAAPTSGSSANEKAIRSPALPESVRRWFRNMKPIQPVTRGGSSL